MTTLQKSEMNPGWVGNGIPSIKSLLVSRPKKIVSLCGGNLSEAQNLSIATLADLWNFYIYRKTRAHCPCCGWYGPGFTTVANWRAVSLHSRCPRCDSRSRHRGQTRYLHIHRDVLKDRKTLIFAPEKVILNALDQIGINDVATTDLISVNVDFPNEDIQELTFADESFGLIICNHVLEHVMNDHAGIAECARVLEPGGIALFTIPGDFDQKKTWYFENADSNGHYRHYGLDVVEKFEAGFSFVSVIDMSTLASHNEHVRKQDMLFVCRKTSNVERRYSR